MCSVCNCFEWTLDLIQRALTLLLSCWLACAVCCGFLIATMAGIAYGYNYSLAEFITISRSDISVYMRRGQFYDKPDFIHPKRRMGEEEEDFSSNLSGDYQELPSDNSVVPDKWQKYQDIRNYAEKLTKYSESRRNLDDYEQVESEESRTKFPMSTHIISTNILPSLGLTTVQRGSSNIVMRMFEPITLTSNTNTEFDRGDSDKIDKYDDLHKVLDKINSNQNNDDNKDEMKTESVSPDIRILFEDEPKSTDIKMKRFWKHFIPKVREYTTNVEEEKVYKSV